MCCTVTSQWYQSRSRTPENLISISGHCWGGRDLGSPVVHIEKVCVHSDGGVAPSQLSSVQIKIEPICLMVELCTMVKILLHKGKSKLSNWRFLGKHSESIVEFSTKGIIVWIIYLNILLSVIFKGLGAWTSHCWSKLWSHIKWFVGKYKVYYLSKTIPPPHQIQSEVMYNLIPLCCSRGRCWCDWIFSCNEIILLNLSVTAI